MRTLGPRPLTYGRLYYFHHVIKGLVISSPKRRASPLLR